MFICKFESLLKLAIDKIDFLDSFGVCNLIKYLVE